MRRITIEPAFLLLVFLGVLCLFKHDARAQELKKSGRYYIATMTKNFTVQPGGTLSIRDIRGDVFVSAWNKNAVVIDERMKMDVYTEEEARKILEKSRSSYRQEDNTIEIGGEYYRRDWIKSEFDIRVPESFRVTIRTSGGDIEVRGVQGDVTVKTSGGDITLEDIGGLLEARTSGGDIAVSNARKAVTLKTSGGNIELANIQGASIASTSGGDIEVRGATSDLDLNTSGGDLDIRDVRGKLIARTSGGDIEVSQAGSDVEVHTSGGDISIQDVSGELQASTSGGDIEAEDLNGFTQLETSGGDIGVTRLNGAVEAKTAGGDVSVTMTLKDFARDHHVDLRTAGGELTLTIPEKLPATIRAEIEITDRWEDYNIYSDFPLTSSEDQLKSAKKRSRRRKYIRSEGDINGGGDAIELYTTNGDIHIKKLRR